MRACIHVNRSIETKNEKLINTYRYIYIYTHDVLILVTKVPHLEGPVAFPLWLKSLLFSPGSSEDFGTFQLKQGEIEKAKAMRPG